MDIAINVINLIICLVIGCKLIFVKRSKKMINTVNGSLLALPATWYLCLIILNATNKAAIELAPFKIFALLAFFTYIYVISYYLWHQIKKVKLRKLRAEVYTLQPKPVNEEIKSVVENERDKIGLNKTIKVSKGKQAK